MDATRARAHATGR